MNPYSHLVIAKELEPHIQPENGPDYYWGAVVPDVRYVARTRRSQTHISPAQIWAYGARYPQLKSFVQGYLVHCLSDSVSLEQIASHRFPISLLKKSLKAQHLPVVLELFYVEQPRSNGYDLSGTHNPILQELGIAEHHTAIFARAFSRYAAAPSFAAALVLFHELGLFENDRLGSYLSSAKRFQDSRVVKRLLFLGLKASHISQEITAAVRSTWPA